MCYGSAVTAIMRDGIDVLVPEDRVLQARERIEELERTRHSAQGRRSRGAGSTETRTDPHVS